MAPSRGWPTIMAELTAAQIPVQILTGTIRIGMTANHRAILRALFSTERPTAPFSGDRN